MLAQKTFNFRESFKCYDYRTVSPKHRLSIQNRFQFFRNLASNLFPLLLMVQTLQSLLSFESQDHLMSLLHKLMPSSYWLQSVRFKSDPRWLLINSRKTLKKLFCLALFCTKLVNLRSDFVDSFPTGQVVGRQFKLVLRVAVCFLLLNRLHDSHFNSHLVFTFQLHPDCIRQS